VLDKPLKLFTLVSKTIQKGLYPDTDFDVFAKDKYLAITYHYMDKNWNVRARVLDLVPVTGNSTGLLTSQLVEQRLDRHFEEKRRLFK
jgi:hypothetical protein